MKEERDELYLQVAHTLAGCQLVEQELKLYITEILALVRKTADKRLPFNYSEADVEDKPLGDLIRQFSKLTNNKQLVKDLDAFRKERNFISHKAIINCLDFLNEVDYSAADALKPRLRKIKLDADKLVERMHEELSKIMVQFVFEPIEP